MLRPHLRPISYRAASVQSSMGFLRPRQRYTSSALIDMDLAILEKSSGGLKRRIGHHRLKSFSGVVNAIKEDCSFESLLKRGCPCGKITARAHAQVPVCHRQPKIFRSQSSNRVTTFSQQ